MKKFDNELFNEKISPQLLDLKSIIASINTVEDIENTIKCLTETIINTCNEIIPKFKVFKNSNNW
jgi:hypothetical protein